MSHLLKTVTVVSLSVLLAACSASHESKRQITGNENYLKTSEMKPLNAPSGMVLPLQYGDYSLPAIQTNGGVGKQVDIRPPVQPLGVLPGSRVQAQVNQAEIRFESANIDLSQLLLTVLKSHDYAIASSGVGDGGRLYWLTDSVSWQRLDEKYAYDARYEISAVGNDYTHLIHVKLTDLRSRDTVITDSAEISRYTVMMLNSIVEGIYIEQNKQSVQAAAQQVGTFVVQSSTDETGLPLLVVRSAYTTVWSALPNALKNIGMSVSDSNRSNGLVTLSYSALSQSKLDDLSVSEINLKSGDYTLQLGDLGNRTSLQFRNSKGQPINQDDNESLVALMQAGFNQAKLD